MFRRLIGARLIRRVPYSSVRARRGRPPRSVALSISGPVADKVVAAAWAKRVCQDLAAGLDAKDTLHVFLDGSLFPEVQPQLQDVAALQFHSPFDFSWEGTELEGLESSETTYRPERHPWLIWMTAALGTQPLDLAVFAGHGFLSAAQGKLALAAQPVVSPTGDGLRYLGARTLAAYLEQAGAWAVGLVAAPANYSRMALRHLADTLARTRPGPVVLAETDTPLAPLVGFLLRPERCPVPPLSATVYAQPQLRAPQDPLPFVPAAGPQRSGFESIVLDRDAPSRSRSLVAAQRTLERSYFTAALVPLARSVLEEARRQGEREAMTEVDELLRKYLADRAEPPPGGNTRGTP